VGTHDIYVWLCCGYTLIFMHFHFSHHYSCTRTYEDMVWYDMRIYCRSNTGPYYKRVKLFMCVYLIYRVLFNMKKDEPPSLIWHYTECST
jgi:hypothetical protein